MNPWQFLRGSLRSLRFDARRRQARKRMNSDTMLLPVIADHSEDPGDRRRHRIVVATGGVLLVAGGVGGYFAVASNLDNWFQAGPPPAGLPHLARAIPSPTPVAQSPVVVASAPATGPTRRPSHKPTLNPPVPTPAPSCSCVTPSPTPSATPSPPAPPTPTPGPTPTPEPSPTPPAAEFN